MRKLLIVPLFVLLFISSDLKACCYNGGEITWECTSNGNFKFTLKLYRECYMGLGYACQFSNHQYLTTTVPGFSSITLYRISGSPIDISPKCNQDTNFSHIYCNSTGPMPNSAPNLGAVQENIFTSDVSYPNGVPLTGVPPAGGWLFHWSSCCRIEATNLIYGSSLSYRLRAIMYPYNNQNISTCFDNSPVFAEIPQTVFCTGYPTTFNYLASDNELDSLVYSWGQPLLSTGAPLTNYVSGYSYNSPFPGPSHNSNNVAATIHPKTGEISFTSHTTGTFLTSTQVTAFKCGIKVAEIWREFQVALTSCGTNNPPSITPPFKNAMGQYTLFIDTVYPGDLVCFNISGTDFEFLPNGTPQTMTLEAYGNQFGHVLNTTPPTMSATSGCLNPPCATLTPAPNPPNNPLTGEFGLNTQFCWQTDCSHLTTNIGCGNTSNVYDFIFKVSDDYCPIPAINFTTITIVVKDYPIVESPEIHCVKVHPNGDVTLNWEIPIDINNHFVGYLIESSINTNGPFVQLDSLITYTQNYYSHIGANAQNQIVYYRIKTVSGCPPAYLNYSIPSPVCSTMKMNAITSAGVVAHISWNPIISPNLSSSSGIYKIFREYPAGSANWTQIANTVDTFYVDTVTRCSAFINYRIEIEDTLGFDSIGLPIFCSSVSSIDGALFSDIMAPVVPIIDSVSVNPITNNVVLAWNTNLSPDCQGYIVYRWDLYWSSWIPIDTVYGINNITFEDTTANPCSNFQTYSVVSFDSCWNKCPLSYLNQNTIKVVATNDLYKPDVYLNWNPYINMIAGLGGYKIYYRENNGSLTYLITVSASDTSYSHIGINNLSNYCYFVQAFDISGQTTSTSCEECILVITSISSQENYNFNLYQNIPNPTNQTTTINYYLPKSGKAVFKVVNIVGEVVYHKKYDSQQGENKIELDISKFESGVYYYSLEFDGVLRVWKMVVLK
ncbi:MAG: T9SS type A sorting domain-containing protein [Saprospiraceae bacterium]|nr:T9SS type A sorting domain-containing protein [Saprospiraceae bacterium]